MVTIPATDDRLVLRCFDRDNPVKNFRGDDLFVVSQPPVKVRKGQALNYTMVVVSRQGGVQCKLVQGPKGMTVSSDGKLTWNVPADLRDDHVFVLVQLTDAGTQKSVHAFTITIQGP